MGCHHHIREPHRIHRMQEALVYRPLRVQALSRLDILIHLVYTGQGSLAAPQVLGQWGSVP